VSSVVVRGDLDHHPSIIFNDCTSIEHISQKAVGSLPENGNIMPKHVGATIHN
jgi:hypothetical protein